MEYGFMSPLWQAKVIIARADTLKLRSAVIELMNALWTNDRMTTEEVFDRLVQVSTTGDYTPPSDVRYEVEDALRMADEILEKYEVSEDLPPEQEAEVLEFREYMERLMGGGEDDDDGEDDEDGDGGRTP